MLYFSIFFIYTQYSNWVKKLDKRIEITGLRYSMTVGVFKLFLLNITQDRGQILNERLVRHREE